jgi:hypothetical protein
MTMQFCMNTNVTPWKEEVSKIDPKNRTISKTKSNA